MTTKFEKCGNQTPKFWQQIKISDSESWWHIETYDDQGDVANDGRLTLKLKDIPYPSIVYSVRCTFNLSLTPCIRDNYCKNWFDLIFIFPWIYIIYKLCSWCNLGQTQTTLVLSMESENYKKIFFFTQGVLESFHDNSGKGKIQTYCEQHSTTQSIPWGWWQKFWLGILSIKGEYL